MNTAKAQLVCCISVMVATVAHGQTAGRDAYLEGKPATPTNIALTSARQLALAFTFYAGDNNDRYPKTSKWEESVWPYIKHTSVITPRLKLRGGGQARYAMNAALSGASLTSIAKPSQTPLLFLMSGTKRHLVGSAKDAKSVEGLGTPVAFADAKARIISTPSELQKLIWKLK